MPNIWGWKTHAQKLGEVCKSYCYDCTQQASWEVAKVTGWITFFNYRAIPLKHEYFIACEACGEDFDLTRRDFKQIKITLRKESSINNSKIKETLFKRIEEHQQGEVDGCYRDKYG